MTEERQPSFDIDRVDGVHYLTDYYAVLGLASFDDTQTIKQAYLQKAKEYHPDRYEGLAPEMRNRAEFKMRVLNRAREVLLDPEKRVLYDRLISEWDGPLSPSGIPIVDLKRPYYGAETSAQALEYARAVDEFVLSGLNFDEGNLRFAKRLHKQNADDADGLLLLEEQLRKKQETLQLREGTMRNMLGVREATRLYSSEAYLEEAEKDVSDGREKFTKRIDRTLTLLQSGVVFQLTGGDEAQSDDAPEQKVAIVMDNSVDKFDAHAQELLELARQTEEIIEERLSLVRGKYIGEQHVSYDQVVVRFNMKGRLFYFAFKRDGVTWKPDESFEDDNLHEYFEEEQAQEAYKNRINVMTIDAIEGLPFMSTLSAALTAHAAHVRLDFEEDSSTE